MGWTLDKSFLGGGEEVPTISDRDVYVLAVCVWSTLASSISAFIKARTMILSLLDCPRSFLSNAILIFQKKIIFVQVMARNAKMAKFLAVFWPIVDIFFCPKIYSIVLSSSYPTSPRSLFLLQYSLS
jgi:hypothetical protein